MLEILVSFVDFSTKTVADFNISHFNFLDVVKKVAKMTNSLI